MIFQKIVYEETGPDGSRRFYGNFIGVGIECLSYSELVSRIDRWISDKKGRSYHIACLNAYCITLAAQNERLRRIYNSADISGPDGMPFVRVLRWVFKRKCDRFAAPDIALYLAEISKVKGYTFYLYGGAPEVLANMENFLRDRYPHIQIVGSWSPPFRPLTSEEDQRLCDEINTLKPDILLVGLGTPKQDYWIDGHLGKIRGSVIVASGATFDFFGGRIKMAPPWIRSSGFEWLFRLCSKDFFRLWKRYTWYNVLFASRFLMQLMGLRTFPLSRSCRSEDY